jgi:hypothetical protein
MRGDTTATALATRILWGLDEAMAGRPRPLRFRCAPAPDAPVVALIEYIAGYACIWVTPLECYGEKTATLLQAIQHCRQSRKVDEIEFCLRHALEPGRSLVFDWLVDTGFAHSEDGHWFVWRSSRMA